MDVSSDARQDFESNQRIGRLLTGDLPAGDTGTRLHQIVRRTRRDTALRDLVTFAAARAWVTVLPIIVALCAFAIAARDRRSPKGPWTNQE